MASAAPLPTEPSSTSPRQATVEPAIKAGGPNSFRHLQAGRQAKAGSFHGILLRAVVGQPPPEKCDVNECANEPNPPRVTLPAPESEEMPERDRLDEESLPKKLLRDDHPTNQLRPPLDEEPRG